MKLLLSRRPQSWFRLVVALSAVACGLFVSVARAGLTLEMNVIRYDLHGYYFDPYLNTNSTPANLPFGDYQLVSSQSPTNGIYPIQFRFDTNGFSRTGGFSWGYSDFDSMKFGLTNDLWSLYATNATTTNVYKFKVTANITSNDLPYVSITFPTNGALNVTNHPTFTWIGPTNYNNLVLYYTGGGASLAVTQTSLSVSFYQGLKSLTVHYDSNSTTAIVSSVPTNSAGQAISSWVSTAHLQDYSQSQFTVGTLDALGTSHTLIAHYPFDATSGPVLNAALDTSGNGYHMTFEGNYGSQGGDNLSSDSAAGIGALEFHNGDGGSAGFLSWTSTPPAILSALAGSFSISCWIKTSQADYGWDEAPAYYGSGIVSADNDGLANDTVPLALTGNKIGFNTGGDVEDVTLNSSANINDGNYHHIVVTRNQLTGQKIIYVDGLFDSFSSGSTNLLNDPQMLTIGALADAWFVDPNNSTFYNGYDGLLDDLQIYSGVLSSNEVLQLFTNPGITTDQVITVPLLGRYNFEITNDIFTAGMDSSGNGNNANCSTGNGGTNVDTFSTDAAKGSYSREFKGDTAICFYQGSTTFNNISNALRGNFSWTAWVKTTNSVNLDFANAYFGLPILAGYSDSVNQMLFSITGSKAAFTTGNPNGGADTTLHSTTTVNDGNYHFIAATRDATSGAMNLYVDGILEDTQVSTNGPRSLTYGLTMAGGNAYNFIGLLDDVRIYSGELSAANVATLAGITPSLTLADALDTTNLVWVTGGDATWFTQTTNTHDSVDAAQSGVIGDNEQTWIETTVTGPGTLSFWWNVDSDDSFSYDYLLFTVDGNYESEIAGNWGWDSYNLNLGAGPHTLRWTYYKDSSDSAGADAGFLDEVSFTFTGGNGSPVITLNPFNQTNYPGYNVALLAAVADSAGITWQWFKVGSGSPIPSATNALFIPTNSGTASVAGGYFAIATNSFGSATTTVATVTFQNAAMPPDWARAFRAQIYGYDNQSPTTNYGIACLVDSTGTNIYTANSFTGTNYFGSEVFSSGGNRFAAGLFKHTASGNTLWGRAITNIGTGNSYPQCLAPAPGDGVYMSGVFFGTNWLGTNQLVETAGGSVFLARFDANGSNLWVRTFGGTNACFQSYHELVADPAGNVTISALGNNLVNFGTTNIVLNGQRGLLAQYDANGNLRWLQLPSGWMTYLAYSAGRIYGAMGGNETNYSGGLTNTSDRQSAVVAMNATNGQAIWIRGVASALGQSTLGDTPRIAVSGTNLFLVGSGAGSNAVFGAYSVSWPVSVGQYFARYDTNGTAQLATAFGSATTIPWATVADASGNVFVGGDFDTYSWFGNKLIAAPINDNIGGGSSGQTFLAKFDRNGNPLWARRAHSPESYANLRDIALANDGIWSVGFVNRYAYFGPHYVSGTVTCIGFPFCTLGLHVGGWLAKIANDDNPVAADLTLEINRQQNPTLGEIFIVYPYFNSVTPAATGTTTNTVDSPTGKFHGEINVSGNKPSSLIVTSLGQLLNEFTNASLWTLKVNKGTANERAFKFSASVSGLTTNLLSAVRIIVPTNGATGVAPNSPFQWIGPTNFSTLGVNKQKSDGTDQASSSLPVTATNWPSPPTLAVGTNLFSVTYTSNNFPNITFSLPIDTNYLSVSNWVTQFKLISSAASSFVVSSGASPVLLVNVSRTGNNFQFAFTSPSGLTNAVQYRTNLAAGLTWQTYSNMVGDGTLKTIQIPISVFSPAQQGFIRIVTQ